MGKNILSMSAILCIIISGCVTTQMNYAPVKDSDTINAGFNKTWSAMVASVSEMSLPIESIEKESGLLTTKQIIFGSGYNTDAALNRIAYRPSVILGTWTQARYSLSIFAQKIGEETTKIKVTTHIEAYESNVSKSWYVCRSNGVTEYRLFSGIKEKLGIETRNEIPEKFGKALNSSDEHQYYNIKKIAKQYFLVSLPKDRVVHKGDIFPIVRPSENYKIIGKGEVVKMTDRDIAFKILNNSKISLSDKIEIK